MVRTLRFGGKTVVPRDYEASFQRVVWLFRHQRVFCRQARGMVHLQPLPPAGLASQDVEVPAAMPESETEANELPFLGPHMPDHIAAGISTGGHSTPTRARVDLSLTESLKSTGGEGQSQLASVQGRKWETGHVLVH